MKRFLAGLITALLLVLALSQCISYKRCAEKYNLTTVDTTYVTRADTVKVPADSAVFVTRTDTTYLTQIVRQGRAVVTMQRTPKTTYVKADCLPTYIVREIKVPVAIKPTFEKPQTGWRTAFFVALGAAIMGWGYFAVFRFFRAA